jgi:farnesyl-diphosphate farnesyltransferase
MIADTAPGDLAAVQRGINPDHQGERTLISQLDRCLIWLRSLDRSDRDEIVAVLNKIVMGQMRDLERFGDATSGVVALQTAAELEDYIYLVAGCVGEFWTRICLNHLENYATIDRARLCDLAVSYGKGLQLVNILRDLPADLRAGRCYLPEDELRAADATPAMLLTEPARSRSVFDRWMGRAAACLEDGRRYISVLRRHACARAVFLPWYLGEKTMTLMRKTRPLEAGSKVKVSRTIVRRAMVVASIAAFSNAPLRGAA